jgi:hypothetical protein
VLGNSNLSEFSANHDREVHLSPTIHGSPTNAIDVLDHGLCYTPFDDYILPLRFSGSLANSACIHGVAPHQDSLPGNNTQGSGLILEHEVTAGFNPAGVQDYRYLDGHATIGYDSAAVFVNTFNQETSTDNIMSIAETDVSAEAIPCFFDGCATTFTRKADLDRHVLNVHNRIGHHCQVPGCNNNKGKGYCRPDKLKEHMWRKHKQVADLSYTKSVPLPFGFVETPYDANPKGAA